MENPIKMDDLGGFTPLFSETSIYYLNKPQIITRAGCQPPRLFDLQTAMARLRFEPRSSTSQEYPAPETENGWLEI